MPRGVGGDGKVNKTITIFAFLLIILSAACKTCPPCVPVHDIVVQEVPVYSCPEPPALPVPALPAWPVLPENATQEEIKEWYVAMETTAKARSIILLEAEKTCREYLDAYRKTP